MDQFLEVNPEKLDPKRGARPGERQQLFVCSPASHLAEEINASQSGQERKIQSIAQRVFVELERLSGRSTAEIGLKRRKDRNDAAKVFGRSRVNDIHILRRVNESMGNSGDSPDRDEIDLSRREGAQDCSEVCFSRLGQVACSLRSALVPARRSSYALFINLSNRAKRSGTESFKASLIKPRSTSFK